MANSSFDKFAAQMGLKPGEGKRIVVKEENRAKMDPEPAKGESAPTVTAPAAKTAKEKKEKESLDYRWNAQITKSQKDALRQISYEQGLTYKELANEALDLLIKKYLR